MRPPPPVARTAIAVGIVAGVLGLAACAAGLAVDRVQALHSWLFAWMFVATLAMGALVFQLIGYAVNGTWMVVLRRLTEGITSVFPWLAVLFVPIVIGVPALYSWADVSRVPDEHTRELIRAKGTWLSHAGFAVRAVIYLAVFVVVAELFRHWSLARDREGPTSEETGRERMAACALLPAVGLAITFASFDWTMSLNPTWYSTAYGVYVFAGGFVGGISVLTVLAWAAQRRGALPRPLEPDHFHALGRMMLAFTIFWAYIAYFQLMLIRIANLPIEVPFYIERSAGSWMALSWVLAIGHFALPFLVLLLRAPKRRPAVMAAAGAWIVLMHVIDIYWLVLPSLHPEGLSVHWLDASALAAVVGTTIAFAAARQLRHAVVPEGDPRLEASYRYRSIS